jgi:hypothetical protein
VGNAIHFKTRDMGRPVWMMRGLRLIEVYRIAWIVYLAADLECIIGRYISGKLIDRGVGPAG